MAAVLPDPAERLRARLRGDLTAALKRRDALTDDDLSRIVEEQISERRSAADAHVQLGRHEDAAQLRQEADVLAEYLP